MTVREQRAAPAGSLTGSGSGGGAEELVQPMAAEDAELWSEHLWSAEPSLGLCGAWLYSPTEQARSL